MKPDQTLHIDIEVVDNAVSLWHKGQLVALPTETVYGLGADANNGEAVARIYQVKSRPQFNPLIVHVANAEVAKRYVAWNRLAEQAANAFWPGPLTLVLKRAAGCSISELVSAGGDSLAVRVPAHAVAQQLLAAFDGGIAAPSANRSGRVSPTSAQHVIDELGDSIPLVVDGGACTVGLESTVLDLSGLTPVLLRPGSITHTMLESALGMRIERHMAGGKITSPGQMESHYAPSIPVRINVTELLPNEALLAFGNGSWGAEAIATLNLSARGDLVEAAAHLFEYMRLLDNAAYAGIAVMPIPAEGIGEAINDRLRRAAHR